MTEASEPTTVEIMAVPTPVKRKLPLVPLLIAVGVLTMVIWGATHGRHAVEARGMAMVLGLQMTNEAMLQTDQPAGAGNFMKALLADRNVVYVIFTDEQGNVKACSDLKVAGQRFETGTLTAPRLSRKRASKDADFEVIGPIAAASGTRIGAVHLGMRYGKK